MKPRVLIAPVLCLLVAAASLFFRLGAQADTGDFAKQKRGQYLVTAGDCVACHTVAGGKPFAGDRSLQTPFGNIYSANITPDPETGIGAWTSEQFYQAMHEGQAPGGKHLYPAFPYPWFTKATREDVDAIFAYLKTVQPVRSIPRANEFPWPLNHRIAMRGWNAVYFTPGEYEPDPHQSAEWNRGAYLVQGLGHCGACHTPKNIGGADKRSEAYQGSEIQNWFAPNLTGNVRTGLGSWSSEDIVTFLQSGHNSRAVAYGPMAEVIKDSTSLMTAEDLRAIATYLKGMPASPSSQLSKPADSSMRAGQAIYNDQCSACHQINGEGIKGIFPSLKGSAVAQSDDPLSMLRLILAGGHEASIPANSNWFSMPAFEWKLTDDQIASVANFIRNSWGNHANPVDGSRVKSIRAALQTVNGAY